MPSTANRFATCGGIDSRFCRRSEQRARHHASARSTQFVSRADFTCAMRFACCMRYERDCNCIMSDECFQPLACAGLAFTRAGGNRINEFLSVHVRVPLIKMSAHRGTGHSPYRSCTASGNPRAPEKHRRAGRTQGHRGDEYNRTNAWARCAHEERRERVPLDERKPDAARINERSTPSQPTETYQRPRAIRPYASQNVTHTASG